MIRGGAKGMPTMTMDITLLGALWSLIVVAIAIFRYSILLSLENAFCAFCVIVQAEQIVQL